MANSGRPLVERRSWMARWGATVARFPKLVIVTWLVASGLGFAAAGGFLGNQPLTDQLQAGEIIVAGEHEEGRLLLVEANSTPPDRTYSLIMLDVDLADPEVAEVATTLVRELGDIEGVVGAVNPYVVPTGPLSPPAAPLVGSDGDSFITVVSTEPELEGDALDDVHDAIDERFDDAVATLDVDSTRGGLAQLIDAILEQLQKDLELTEYVSLPVSFIAMLFVFGGFVAAGLPIFGAVASIAGGLLALVGWVEFIALDQTAPNVVIFLGLGLCIDYGLLMVSRFREEMRARLQGADRSTITRPLVVEATAAAMERAGRTIAFSGLTVATSLAGMMVFDIDLMRGIAAAGMSVVLVAIAVGNTLIPALCVISAKTLVRKSTEVTSDEGMFSRLARGVQRVPWLIIVAVSALLGFLATPALDLSITSSSKELIPEGSPDRVFFETFEDQFPVLSGPEVLIVTKAPAEELSAWSEEAAQLTGVDSVDPVAEVGDGVRTLGLRTGDGGQGPESRALVEQLREDRPPFEAWTVSGASHLYDFERAIADRLWIAIALVMVATMALLFLATGSLVIPLKAIFMNVLSLGAAIGVTVWIFQEGNGESLLGFSSVGAIEETVPMMLLAFGFGLSMDYEVFLLSRVVELHESGLETKKAVSLGLQRSGRIITSAALLLVIVFSTTAAAKMLVLKELGVGLVIAIAIDATLVRMLLVPATMSVLGAANWWAPAPLKRFHARWGIKD